MLSRALDEIIHATRCLPDHLVAARRCYGHDPRMVAALRQLQDALMEVDAAILRGVRQADALTALQARTRL